MNKFEKLIREFKKDLFPAATTQDMIDRRTGLVKSEIKKLNDTFGQLQPGDYVLPMEDIAMQPINRKSYKLTAKLDTDTILKVIEIDDTHIKLLKSYSRKWLEPGINKQDDYQHQRQRNYLMNPRNMKNIENLKRYIIIDALTIKDPLNLNVFHKGSLYERFGLKETAI